MERFLLLSNTRPACSPDGEEMTEWLRDALAMTAVVISGLLWLRTLLFMVTDWGVTRRRFVLFSALFLRTVFTVALVAATWRWSTEDWQKSEEKGMRVCSLGLQGCESTRR